MTRRSKVGRKGVTTAQILGGIVLVLGFTWFISQGTFAEGGFLSQLQNWAQQILGLGYAASAVNSAKAMSYAYSCTSLIHSATNCGDVLDNPGNYDSWEVNACRDMKSDWNNDAIPRSDRVDKSCKRAAGKGATFGDAVVTCTDFDSAGGGDAGCTVDGFTLPQKFGGDIMSRSKQFLLGYGAPKYLLYYEAYDPTYANEWERRLTSTSALALAGSAVANGIAGAVLVMGTAPMASAKAVGVSGKNFLEEASQKGFRGATADAFKRFLIGESSEAADGGVLGAVRGLGGKIKKWLPEEASIPAWDDIPVGKKTMADVWDSIEDELAYKLTYWRRGLYSLQDLMRRSTDEVEDVNYKLSVRAIVADELDFRDRLQPETITGVLWGDAFVFQGKRLTDVRGLSALFDEDALGRTLREMVEDGDTREAREAVRERLRAVRGASRRVDSVPRVELSDEEIDHIAKSLVGTAEEATDTQYLTRFGKIRVALSGEDLAAKHGMDRETYWLLTAYSSSEAENILEIAQKSPKKVPDLVEARLEKIADEGDTILRNVEKDELADVVGGSGAAICGSAPMRRFAVYAATAGIADQVVPADKEQARAVMATIPAAAEQAQLTARQLSLACGNGRNPLSVIKGAAGVYGAYLTASFLAENARQVRSNLPKMPQGTNELVLVRGNLHATPMHFPLNKYANWWFMNLNVKNGPGMRFMTASPCYTQSEGSGQDGKITIRRGQVNALLKAASTGPLNIIRGTQVAGMMKPKKNSCRWDASYGYRDKAGERSVRRVEGGGCSVRAAPYRSLSECFIQKPCEGKGCYKAVESCSGGSCAAVHMYSNPQVPVFADDYGSCEGAGCFKKVDSCGQGGSYSQCAERLVESGYTDGRKYSPGMCRTSEHPDRPCFQFDEIEESQKEERKGGGICRGAVYSCQPLEKKACAEMVGCNWVDKVGECWAASNARYPLSCKTLNDRIDEASGREKKRSICEGKADGWGGLTSQVPGGRLTMRRKSWSRAVQGSYAAWWGVEEFEVAGFQLWGDWKLEEWIMYTKRPIVHPTPNLSTGTRPPGMGGDDFRSTIFIRGAADSNFSSVPVSQLPETEKRDVPGERDRIPYYDQRGWWFKEGGNWKRYIPFRKITSGGTGAKLVMREGKWTWTRQWSPFEKVATYDLDVLDVRFKNMNWGRKGGNYCFATHDWGAEAAKIGIVGTSIGLEAILDSVDFASLGSSYLATAAFEFGIGTGEYMLTFWADTQLENQWPQHN
ncbi:MAG: hypothetical protein SVQ76_01250 [Candidatus Nanohaloarchaea archaeon]|nr:hypothetical protein [Candidatus Nanohaloarchaea archaeon]